MKNFQKWRETRKALIAREGNESFSNKPNMMPAGFKNNKKGELGSFALNRNTKGTNKKPINAGKLRLLNAYKSHGKHTRKNNGNNGNKGNNGTRKNNAPHLRGLNAYKHTKSKQ